jgi:hypothetical protein
MIKKEPPALAGGTVYFFIPSILKQFFGAADNGRGNQYV